MSLYLINNETKAHILWMYFTLINQTQKLSKCLILNRLGSQTILQVYKLTVAHKLLCITVSSVRMRFAFIIIFLWWKHHCCYRESQRLLTKQRKETPLLTLAVAPRLPSFIWMQWNTSQCFHPACRATCVVNSHLLHTGHIGSFSQVTGTCQLVFGGGGLTWGGS